LSFAELIKGEGRVMLVIHIISKSNTSTLRVFLKSASKSLVLYLELWQIQVVI